MDKHWLEYVKSCYDLVIESESNIKKILEHEVEAYVVHLMARNFKRIDIGQNPIAIQLLTAMNKNSRPDLLSTADECLLIHSFPLKQNKWPSATYYQEMGITAYGLAGHMMEKNFIPASQIIHAIFNRNLEKMLGLH